VLVRLFVLSSRYLDDFQLRVLDVLFETGSVGIVGACIDGSRPPSKLARLRRELRKGRGGYVLIMALGTLGRRRGDAAVPAADYFQARAVECAVVEDLYSDATISFIRGTRPGCLFRTGFGIIREPILSLAPAGVISFHHGDMRKYRGQPVGFWELYHRESEIRVCVQLLNERLDAGRIVVEQTFPIHQSDSWSSVERRAFEGSPHMVREACLRLDSPSFVPETIPEAQLGKLYTTPNLRQWATLQAKIAMRKIRASRR
jgi:methionyl-tRNA formyltransferase